MSSLQNLKNYATLCALVVRKIKSTKCTTLTALTNQFSPAKFKPINNLNLLGSPVLKSGKINQATKPVSRKRQLMGTWD